MTTSLCGNVLFAIPLAGTELGLMSEAAASVALHTVAMSTTVFHMSTFPTEVALRVAARGRARAMRAAAHFLPALVFYFLRARWSSFRSCSLRLPRFLLRRRDPSRGEALWWHSAYGSLDQDSVIQTRIHLPIQCYFRCSSTRWG